MQLTKSSFNLKHSGTPSFGRQSSSLILADERSSDRFMRSHPPTSRVRSSLKTAETPQPLRLEAEQMSLSGYAIKTADHASGGRLIDLSAKSSGKTSIKFDGENGKYNVILGYFDETDGKSSFKVKLNGSTLDSFKAQQTSGSTTPNAASFKTSDSGNKHIADQRANPDD